MARVVTLICWNMHPHAEYSFHLAPFHANHDTHQQMTGRVVCVASWMWCSVIGFCPRTSWPRFNPHPTKEIQDGVDRHALLVLLVLHSAQRLLEEIRFSMISVATELDGILNKARKEVCHMERYLPGWQLFRMPRRSWNLNRSWSPTYQQRSQEESVQEKESKEKLNGSFERKSFNIMLLARMFQDTFPNLVCWCFCDHTGTKDLDLVKQACQFPVSSLKTDIGFGSCLGPIHQATY